ncbi:hypothetical protein GOODEAATRI_001492 [Goodea atripinnis]|uniref:Uncharacterized protein n=1 Tax=Goodea atripinnis TaxID=208336 RepID=A0ABV0P0Q8_9TELE
MPGKVQEAGELPSGRNPETESRDASALVSRTRMQRGCDCILSSCQRQPQKPLVCFVRLIAPVVLSQSSATQTANRLTPCSSLQMHQAQHPARPEIMDMDSALILLCKWAEQMTSSFALTWGDFTTKDNYMIFLLTTRWCSCSS